MTPPSLTVAREILADAARATKARGDRVAEIPVTAIDVVLAALDQSIHGAASVIAVATTHGTAIPTEALVAEILPCPFCRCATVTVGAGPFETRWRAVCADCGASGPLAKSDGSREAIANWNRRPGVPSASPAPYDFRREPAYKLGPEASAVSVEQRAARLEAVRKLAADAGLGEQWAQDMIDAGCTIEQAREGAFTALLSRTGCR